MFYPLKLKWIYSWFKNRLGRIKFYLSNFLTSPGCAFNYFKFMFSKSKIKVNHSPISINFYITDKCNLNCYMCVRNLNEYPTVHHKKIDDMDFETFKAILDKFKCALYVQLIGQGEPLLNKDIFKMVDLVNKKRKNVILFTNGVLLNKENIKMIFNHHIYWINISLKGIDEEDFASVARVNGEIFYKVIENIKNLIAARKRFHINTIISISYICSKENFRNMYKAVKLANNLSVDRLYFTNLAPPDIYIGCGLEKMFFEDDEAAIKELKSLRRYPTNIKIHFPIFFRRGSFNRYCPYYYKYINVDAKGDVVGCDRVLTPNEKYGNVFRDKDIYNTQHFLKMRKIFLNKIEELPDYCKLCVDMSC